MKRLAPWVHWEQLELVVVEGARQLVTLARSSLLLALAAVLVAVRVA